MRKGGLVFLEVLVYDCIVLIFEILPYDSHRFFRDDVVAISIDLSRVVRVHILNYPEDISVVLFLMSI